MLENLEKWGFKYQGIWVKGYGKYKKKLKLTFNTNEEMKEKSKELVEKGWIPCNFCEVKK